MKEKSNLKKILLVADVPGWAFDHRAKDMMNMPSDKVKLDLKYLHQVKKEDIEEYDLIYPMAVIMAYSLYKKGFPLNKLGAGITSMRQFRFYQHKDKTFYKSFDRFFKDIHIVNTASDEFVDYFSQYRPVHKTRVGIDHHVFKPLPSRPRNKVFTIGWVGSSTDSKIKGFDVIKEAVNGLNIKLDIRTKTNNFVSREQMLTFYQNLDCFICSSKSEHLPLPILEAAACGVPIISTKVGIVPELIKSFENGIIVERKVEPIRNAIQYVMNNPNTCEKMSDAIRSTITNGWTWDICWEKWEDFFILANYRKVDK